MSWTANYWVGSPTNCYLSIASEAFEVKKCKERPIQDANNRFRVCQLDEVIAACVLLWHGNIVQFYVSALIKEHGNCIESWYESS